MTPPPQAEGGLANAIFGSLMMVGLATLIGTPIGVLAGIYLAEYGQKTWLGSVVRFINDILLSAPSIVMGLFIYAVVVAQVKSFSAIAGVLALALIVMPVVIRQTENMLSLVPNALREAAYALGTPKWKVIGSVTLKAARPASSPASCWRWRASRARRRRCCSPRCPTSSGPATCASRWPACR
jgi:phosphate transport system permease protein